MKPISAIALLVVLSVAPIAAAQDTGLPQWASMEASPYDVINRANLNVLISIPIMSVPGRAGNVFSHSLVYNSLVWRRQGTTWVPDPKWGWMTDAPTGRDATFIAERVSCTPNSLKAGVTPNAPPVIYTTEYHDYSFTDEKGTKHTFPLDFFLRDYFGCGWVQQPRVAFADDGSGYKIDATVPTNPIVTNKDGYRVGTVVTDRNGNSVSSLAIGNETDWIDTTGRTALKISYLAGETQFKVANTSGVDQTTRLIYTSKNIATAFGCTSVTEYTGTALLPTSLVLPTGKSYTFEYEPTPGNPTKTTGRLLRMTLPTGGSIEYIYPTTPNGGVTCADGKLVSLTRVVHNDPAPSATWTYVRTPASPPSNPMTTVITYPAVDYDGTSVADQSRYTFDSGGKETKREVFQGTTGAGTLLLSVETAYATTGTPFSATTTYGSGTSARVSKAESTYDDYGNLTRIKSYGWRDSGGTFPLVRTTVLTYLSSTSYADRNIRSLVSQQRTYAGSDTTGTLADQVDYTYDGTPCSATDGSPANHDNVNYGVGFNVRGNLTKITRYADLTNQATTAVTRQFAYDTTGNLIRADDDSCRLKTWTYTSATQWSYPSTETRGAVGGPQLLTSATYDTHTGQPLTTTDENGAVTSYYYDTFGRPTVTALPENTGSPEVTYDDSAMTVSTKSPIQNSDALVQKSVPDGLGRVVRVETTNASGSLVNIQTQTFDARGRAWKACLPKATASDTSYCYETRYDALNRVKLLIPPDGSSSTYFSSWSYDGNTVTATDPVGHQKAAIVDALGRTSVVTEPDDTGALNITTGYEYDVLNRLLAVRQPVTNTLQTRTFTYDGLGRMVQEVTPEAGTVNHEYSPLGMLTKTTDARGVATTFTHDSLNRLIGVAYDPGTSGVPGSSAVSYDWDGTEINCHGAGRRSGMHQGGNGETYCYDVRGLATRLRQTLFSTTYEIGWTYNLAGEVHID